MTHAACTDRSAGSSRQPRVSGEQEGVSERFGERQVGRVIGCEVVSQAPDSLAQRSVRVAHQADVAEVLDGLLSTLIGDLPGTRKTAKGVERLGLDEVRDVQWIVLMADQLTLDRLNCLLATQQKVCQDRRVEDDQRVSRAARMTVTLDGPS